MTYRSVMGHDTEGAAPRVPWRPDGDHLPGDVEPMNLWNDFMYIVVEEVLDDRLTLVASPWPDAGITGLEFADDDVEFGADYDQIQALVDAARRAFETGGRTEFASRPLAEGDVFAGDRTVVEALQNLQGRLTTLVELIEDVSSSPKLIDVTRSARAMAKVAFGRAASAGSGSAGPGFGPFSGGPTEPLDPGPSGSSDRFADEPVRAVVVDIATRSDVQFTSDRDGEVDIRNAEGEVLWSSRWSNATGSASEIAVVTRLAVALHPSDRAAESFRLEALREVPGRALFDLLDRHRLIHHAIEGDESGGG